MFEYKKSKLKLDMKFLKSTLLMTALAAVVFACGPKGNTVETSDAKAVANSADAKAVAVNTEASFVTWIGSKPAGKHNGSIGISAGELNVKGSEIVGGKLTIDITSLKCLDLEEGGDSYGKLVGHLLSPDFFDATTHPTATFEVTGVSKFTSSNLEADQAEFETEHRPATLSEIMVENPTHFISGNLTIRGTTKNITFPAAVSIDNGVIRASANFNIDRTAWGLMYGDEASVADKAKDRFIYNTVNVGFELEAGNGPMANAD